MPRQLPADIFGFTGREAQLAGLHALAAVQTPAVVISAVSGTAGVGKTALAVHWAHQVAGPVPRRAALREPARLRPGRFGDASPAEAVRGFLDALRACRRSGSRPASTAQAGLYRSLLAGRRMLVVLDNARDAEQVRPLLPGSAGLPGAGHQPQPAHRPGRGRRRPPADRSTCSSDPGGPRAAGPPARAATGWRPSPRRSTRSSPAARGCRWRWPSWPPAPPRIPGFPLAALARRTARGRAAAWTPSTAGTRPPTCGRCSPGRTARSSDRAARLFRLLGLHPGPGHRRARRGQPGRRAGRPGAPAAGRAGPRAPARRSTPRAGTPSTTCCAPTPPSWRTTSDDARPTGDAALHRMLDHYLHTAHAAATLLTRTASRSSRPPPAPGRQPRAARRQRRQALALVHRRAPGAAGRRRPGGGAPASTRHAWQLAWTLGAFLRSPGALARPGRHPAHAALDAARRLADRTGRPHAHRDLGLAHVRLGRDDDAHRHLQQALRPVRATRPTTPARRTPTSTWPDLLDRQGRYRRGARPRRSARSSCSRPPATGPGRPAALNAIGWLLRPARRPRAGPRPLRAGPRAAAGDRRPPRRGRHLGQPRLRPPPPRPTRGGRRLLPSGPSTCSARSATATARPTYSATSARPTWPPGTSTLPGPAGRRR